jgi:hypothetical protein
MTRFLAAMVALLLTVSSASAISRYDPRSRTCSAVQALIAGERAVQLRYPSRDGRVMLYDTYVSRGYQCGFGYYAAQTYVPTLDRSSCLVYNCQSTQNLAP